MNTANAAMDTATVATRARRRPLSTPGRVTLAVLIGLALTYAALGALLWQLFFPAVGIVFGAGFLVAAGAVAAGWRWAPALGALVCGLVLIEEIPYIPDHFVHPETAAHLTFGLIAMPLLLVGLAAGIGATVRNYRSPR